MQPLISVIIVNYRADRHLARAIKSVKTFPGAEVITVDNSPPHPNRGFSKAVNLGVAQSQGKYLCLLNPDAELGKGALDQMLHTIREFDDHAVVAPRLQNSDATPQPSCYRPQSVLNAIKEFWFGIKGSYSKYLPKQTDRPTAVHAAVAACWLLPRTVWNRLGGLDEKFFLYFEDLDFCDRAGRLGIPIIYDPRATVTHEHGASAATNKETAQLFLTSATTYHGVVKKILIDAVIKTRDFFTPPISIKKIILTTLLYLTMVTGVMMIGYFALPARYAPSTNISSIWHSNFMLWSLANFDGDHYLSIAKHGYQTINAQSEYAFFPLYPLLINSLTRLGLDNYLAARLIGIASLVGFIILLIKWVSPYLKNPLNLMWLVLLSPGTIFLLSVYTEPLFLLLAVLTFYFADQKKWGKAALFTALATATRISGIFLVLFLLVKIIRSHRPLSILHYPFLGLSGLFAYMYYLWQKVGDPLAWYHAQSGWAKSTATLPWVTAMSYAKALTSEFVPDLTHLVVAIEVVLTLLLLYLLILFWKKGQLDLSYKLYVSGSLALPLITGSLGSMPRFSLTLFPIFLIIPSLPRAPRIIICTLFAVSCMLGIILFTRGYWYA